MYIFIIRSKMFLMISKESTLHQIISQLELLRLIYIFKDQVKSRPLECVLDNQKFNGFVVRELFMLLDEHLKGLGFARSLVC